MGNGQHVAAVAGLQAFLVQGLPQALLGGCFYVGGREALGGGVAEDDIAVDVAASRHAGPLVANEGRETAGRATVVVSFGGLLDFLPGAKRRLQAHCAATTAERVTRGQLAAVDVAVDKDVAQLGKPAHHPAHQRVVSFLRWIIADTGFAQQVAVVGDDGKIQRPSELYAARGEAVSAVRLYAQGFAPGKTVGVSRPGHGSLAPGVKGQGGVDVRVAEERAAKGIVVGAG